ncbi:MAG: hypothetical protein GKS01_09660 [Alphaproteobacteria bacterium]|nr:hypothetical protein [Alphaproteobacteria bacterium]
MKKSITVFFVTLLAGILVALFEYGFLTDNAKSVAGDNQEESDVDKSEAMNTTKPPVLTTTTVETRSGSKPRLKILSGQSQNAKHIAPPLKLRSRKIDKTIEVTKSQRDKVSVLKQPSAVEILERRKSLHDIYNLISVAKRISNRFSRDDELVKISDLALEKKEYKFSLIALGDLSNRLTKDRQLKKLANEFVAREELGFAETAANQISNRFDKDAIIQVILRARMKKIRSPR